MTAKNESLLISAVLETKDHRTPALLGVKRYWFATYPDEWEWIERFIERHRSVPSVGLFGSKFPGFRLTPNEETEYACNEVRQDYLRRSAIKQVEALVQQLGVSADPMEAISKLQGGLQNLVGESAAGVANEQDMVDDWESVYNEVERRWQRANERGLAGIPTGFGTLDLVTHGPQEGDFWIVAARLGQGKTWTLLRMACTALLAGHTVQYNALEQSRTQIAMRAHSFLSTQQKRFTTQDLMSGRGVDLMAYKTFLQELKENLSGRFIVNDTSRGRVSPSMIAAQIERNKPDIVFIDYLTLMNGQAGDWQAISNLSGELKGLAMRYSVPIVAAAQINRMGIGDDLPGAEHLAGADAIGQDADAVVTLVQKSRHVVRMKLAKYRHGSDGMMWWNEFRPNSGLFVEITGDHAQDLMDQDRLEDA